MMDRITTMFFNDVMGEMQNAEEAGGPVGEQYIALMEAIAAEASRRARVYRSRLVENGDAV